MKVRNKIKQRLQDLELSPDMAFEFDRRHTSISMYGLKGVLSKSLREQMPNRNAHDALAKINYFHSYQQVNPFEL